MRGRVRVKVRCGPGGAATVSSGKLMELSGAELSVQPACTRRRVRLYRSSATDHRVHSTPYRSHHLSSTPHRIATKRAGAPGNGSSNGTPEPRHNIAEIARCTLCGPRHPCNAHSPGWTCWMVPRPSFGRPSTVHCGASPPSLSRGCATEGSIEATAHANTLTITMPLIVSA